MSRKFPLTAVALLTTSLAAVVGLSIADQIEQDEPALMFAGVAIEEPHQRGTELRQGAERKLAAMAPQAAQPVTPVEQSQQEARNLADAILWAERYRQRQDAMRQGYVLKQRREQERKIAEIRRPQADAASERPQDSERKLTDAPKALQKVACVGSCTTEAAKTAATVRQPVRTARTPSGPASTQRAANPGCPLSLITSVLP